ncbi:MAG: 5'-nucleotidase C-terminal domain-containing protein, partial [Alphaproteobacteria bacterium]|nr:5'-nucleotidase C-terminal domain-containing protein [Alphaproteobacteria bacterium]
RTRLTFLHVNDVYEIEPRDGWGGFAGLMTLLERERAQAEWSITTFGGDLLSPSLMSTVTRGAHMMGLLGDMRFDLAVPGNHEFDFGPEVLAARLAESRFPWIVANLARRGDGQPFAGMAPTAMRQAGPFMVGFVGLITPETADQPAVGDGLTFSDPLDAARTAVAALRSAGADVVVALTHLDLEQDRALVRAVPGIDLVLGGHDHAPASVDEGHGLIVKAGQDARWLTVVELAIERKDTPKGPSVEVVPSWRMIANHRVTPHPELALAVAAQAAVLDAELGTRIGVTATDLDSLESNVRTRETSFGNLITDAMREATGADAAILNGGSIRGDRLLPAGTALTRRDVLAELPFANVSVVASLKGHELRAALEHGLSAVETAAGRFPQVSGLVIAWDPAAPAGARLRSVLVGGRPLDDQTDYRVATTDFLTQGGDGYAMLTKAPLLVDQSDARLITALVIDHIARRGEVAPVAEGRIEPLR